MPGKIFKKNTNNINISFSEYFVSMGERNKKYRFEIRIINKKKRYRYYKSI